MINCNNPTILLNPYYYYLLHEHHHVHLMGKDYIFHSDTELFSCNTTWKMFDFHLIYPKCNNITELEAEKAYILNKHTGEMINLYLVVPCGKCIICESKKVKEWECRAMCETAKSTSYPLFITLTYDDKHRHADEQLHKEDVSLWLRKFRDFCRYHYNQDNIRFACCGEYGGKRKREHYHVILWNVPYFGSWSNLLDVIETTWERGFVYVKPSNMGAISYLMKYIQKQRIDIHNISPLRTPQNNCTEVSEKAKPFFFASRRNGLGNAYLMDNLQFFRKNLSLQFSVTDPFSGVTKEYTLPRYFVNILFPTLSKLVPREIRFAYKLMTYLHGKIRTFFNDEFADNPLYPYIKKKFSFLPYANHNIKEDDVLFHKTFQKDGTIKDKCNQLETYFNDIWQLYEQTLYKLFEFKFEISYEEMLLLKKFRSDKLERYFENNDVTRQTVAYKSKILLEKYRSILRNQKDMQ